MSYPGETFVLTPGGWRTIAQITHEDRVAELDHGALVFSHPADVSSKNFHGKLVSTEARNYGMLTTPDHVHRLTDKDGNFKTKAISADLTTNKLRRLYIRVAAPMAHREREVHDPDFARLVGMLRSNMLIFNRTHLLSRVKLSTIRPYMMALMQQAGVTWTRDAARFKVERHPRIMAYFDEHGRLRRSTVLALDNESRKRLVFSLMSWNARIRPPSFSTEICRLPYDDVVLLHEVCARTGISSVERLVKKEWIHVKVRPEQRNMLPASQKSVDYSGRVYALAMPSGTLLTRTNLKPALTGDGSCTI